MDEALEKDPVILDTLSRLRAALGARAFDVVDHWSGDLIAVGIASPQNHQVLVYIAAFEDGFYAELELPPPPGDESLYRVAGSRSGLTFDQLAAIVAEHLSLGSPPQGHSSHRPQYPST